MLTIYKPAEYLLVTVNTEISRMKYRNEYDRLERLTMLKRMLEIVEPNTQVAIDEELFKFLDM